MGAHSWLGRSNPILEPVATAAAFRRNLSSSWAALPGPTTLCWQRWYDGIQQHPRNNELSCLEVKWRYPPLPLLLPILTAKKVAQP